MSESSEHFKMKYRLMNIAKKLGYLCTTEMESPIYMSFFTGRPKKIIDVWCEYCEKRDNITWGRQVPIEIYYSEKVTKIDLDPEYNNFRIDPTQSFRLVVCNNVDRPYTITKEQSGKYFDLHIIPFTQIQLVETFLEYGKEYLKFNYKQKINELGDGKNVCY